jgi:hypothetical protein
MTDVSTDQLWEDLNRLLAELQMSLDEFQRAGKAGDLGDKPILEYAYKAIWPLLEETIPAA